MPSGSRSGGHFGGGSRSFSSGHFGGGRSHSSGHFAGRSGGTRSYIPSFRWRPHTTVIFGRPVYLGAGRARATSLLTIFISKVNMSTRAYRTTLRPSRRTPMPS